MEKIAAEDFEKAVGRYIFVRRNGQRNVAKLEWVDTKDKRFGYTLMSGRDKGRKASAKFFTGTFVNVYNEESLVVALLEV